VDAVETQPCAERDNHCKRPVDFGKPLFHLIQRKT
jgi:hypothetical protein